MRKDGIKKGQSNFRRYRISTCKWTSIILSSQPTLEKLNAIKLGREYRVYEEDLIKFENERKTIPSK